MYVVGPSTRSTRLRGMYPVRGNIAVNPALWRCRLRESGPTTGSGSVSTPSFWPLSYSSTGIHTVYVGYRARRNHSRSRLLPLQSVRDCCGLPIIGRRTDNPLSRLLSFLSSALRTLLWRATAKFLVLSSSRSREDSIFLCTSNVREVTMRIGGNYKGCYVPERGLMEAWINEIMRKKTGKNSFRPGSRRGLFNFTIRF